MQAHVHSIVRTHNSTYCLLGMCKNNWMLEKWVKEKTGLKSGPFLNQSAWIEMVLKHTFKTLQTVRTNVAVNVVFVWLPQWLLLCVI